MDFWANIYGLLIGTPCIFSYNQNIYIYNYLPPDNLIKDFEEGKSNFTILNYKYDDENKKTKKIIYDENSIINSEYSKKEHYLENLSLVLDEGSKYKDIVTAKDPTLSRYYFTKYLKYKNKYLFLKNNF
jgi:hypothetical protein